MNRFPSHAVVGFLFLCAAGLQAHAAGDAQRGAAEPANLKRASADVQVISLHHCRDIYVVRTAAGKTLKVREYNLRLKTDSSLRGPNLGKPVMTESGMRGDRFSIVFASPKELGEFIKETCE